MKRVKHLLERVTLGTLAAILATALYTSCTFSSTTPTPTPTKTPKPTFTLVPTYALTPTSMPPTLVPTYTPTATPTPIPPPTPTIPFDEQRISELHSELLKIIEEINPEVIGFGEIHRELAKTDYYPSTSIIFALHLLGPLQMQGFNDLVWEGLYYHFPQEELENFYRTGIAYEDSELWKAYSLNRDPDGFLSILIRSAELGLSLYGSSITEQEHITIFGDCSPEMECYEAANQERLELISTHATEQANELLALEKKVLLYGGASHNNLLEEVADENVSFGDDINTDSYLEVDLLDPSLIYIYEWIKYEDLRSMIKNLRASGLEVDLQKGGIFLLSSRDLNRVVVLYPCRFDDCESVLSLY